MTLHKTLSSSRWNQFTFFEQMANIGSEVGRAIKWKNKGKREQSLHAFDRALELIDLTAKDPSNRKKLRELMRVREALADFLVFDNEYSSNDKAWEQYFLHFNYACRVTRKR